MRACESSIFLLCLVLFFHFCREPVMRECKRTLQNRKEKMRVTYLLPASLLPVWIRVVTLLIVQFNCEILSMWEVLPMSS
jgi:hypothetical protein